jgi:ribulose 1,5-bisphosphate synthetase/thiazole synthase
VCTGGTVRDSAHISLDKSGGKSQCKRRVIVIGAGLGDLSAAKRLANSRCRFALIDRHNYPVS